MDTQQLEPLDTPLSAAERAAAAARRPGRGLSGVLPGLGERRLSVQRDSVYRRALGLADISAATFGLLIVVTCFDSAAITAFSLLALPLCVLLSKLFGLYDRDELVLWTTTLDEAPQVFLLACMFTIIVWFGERFFISGHLRKPQFVVLWVSVFIGTLVMRAVARRCARALTKPERCLLLSESPSIDRVRARLRLGQRGTGEVVLWTRFDCEGCDALLDGGLAELARIHGIDRVLIADGAHNTDSVLELVRVARALHLKVSLFPQFWETLGSLVVDEMPGTAMLAVRRFGPNKSSQRIKRAFDVVLAGAGVVIVSPLLAIIALAVKFDSSGPVLFRQTRIGRYSRPFQMLKFRTMVRDADGLKTELRSLNQAEGLFKILDDPRRTRVGRWLRRANLDELPQLFNVLRGDMSLVGPRPLIPEEDVRIEGWQRQRLEMPPGITGHWQVLGSARVAMSEMVVIDYLYIANWSLWLDIKCLVRTTMCVLARRGM